MLGRMPASELSEQPTAGNSALPAIAARALRRSFGDGIEAVREIDLTVRAGEVFDFLGPNGAGKTTTVRMPCTLLAPSAGSATVAGLDVVRDAAQVRWRIGVALQEIGLDPVQTGRELLELQCGLYGLAGQRRHERAQQRLELVGLTEAADRRTKTSCRSRSTAPTSPRPRRRSGGCRGSSASSRSATRSPCTSRTAPDRSSRSCAGSSTPASKPALSRSPGHRSTTSS